jgi:uncharacterized protein
VYPEEDELLLHPRSIRCAVLLFLLLCSPISRATDIQCESTQQPAQRVICDHAILNHEYDDIYEQQQKLIQQGKLTQHDLAAWNRKRDGCADVHCIDGVFAQWSAIDKGLENSAGTPTIAASEALGTPVITASEALGPAPGASPAAAEASQQSSSVPVSRLGSAYGVALPQSVPSNFSVPAPISEASATTRTSGGTASLLFFVLGTLLVIAGLGVGAILIYQRRR